MEYKNEKGFTKEELIELGINYDNMSYPYGEMNVIVQWFGRPKVNEDGDESDYAYPDIYMPRKNRVWSVTDKDINLSDEDDRKEFIAHLRDSAERLKICRDTYWTIYGEENGLGKPWEPDWTIDDVKYSIFTIKGMLSKTRARYDSAILSFPTAEMRDAFYENFKKEIEICKEFL